MRKTLLTAAGTALLTACSAGTSGVDLADLDESAWELCSEQAFIRRWASEAKDAESQARTETVYLATGLLLPIWSSLPKDRLAVHRIVDGAGQSWLGRIVDDADVPGLLKTFEVEAELMLTPEAILSAVQKGKPITVERPFPMTIKRSLVASEQRIEICGEIGAQLEWLKSLGCFTEVIQYKTRAFVPVKRSRSVLTALIK